MLDNLNSLINNCFGASICGRHIIEKPDLFKAKCIHFYFVLSDYIFFVQILLVVFCNKRLIKSLLHCHICPLCSSFIWSLYMSSKFCTRQRTLSSSFFKLKPCRLMAIICRMPQAVGKRTACLTCLM